MTAQELLESYCPALEPKPAVDIETASESYARRFSGSTGDWLLSVQARGTLDILRQWPNATVLEVGGGHAQLTPYLIDAGYDVTVHGSAEICRSRVNDYLKNGQINFVVSALQSLPFPDKSFDVVIAYHLLSHLEDWKPFAKELMRIARKAVVIDYPTTRSLNGLMQKLFWLKKGVEGNTRTFITYREDEVVRHFTQAGLTRGKRFGKFFIPMVIHRAFQLPSVSAFIEGFFRAIGATHAFGSPVIQCFTKGEKLSNRK